MLTNQITVLKSEFTQGLRADLAYFKTQFPEILAHGIDAFFPPPFVSDSKEAYVQFIVENKLNNVERSLLVLMLLPIVDSVFMHQLFSGKNEFQLIQSKKTGQLYPSGETFLLLMSGDDLEKRIALHEYLGTNHLFYRKGVFTLGETDSDTHNFCGKLKMSTSYVDLFLYNRTVQPHFSPEFPAHLLETHFEWSDLMVNPATADKLEEIKDYLDYNDFLRKDWGLKKHMKAGYRCLFYGPSGTGKTLAATLLGKHIGREVYRVDISSVVSKYVGETAKNLHSLFNTAEDKNWILFFDEGDALFGKRVDTSESENKNSHFANQDIAYLLQRIENYNGLVIVASNFKKNMDDAFSRRFQNAVHFDILNAELSKQYWMDNLPEQVTLNSSINLDMIVQRDKLSPASIINVINRVCLKTVKKETTEIAQADLDRCIKDELYK